MKNKRPTWCHLLFYFTSYALNMFWTLIYPSSGACDYSVELPHKKWNKIASDIKLVFHSSALKIINRTKHYKIRVKNWGYSYSLYPFLRFDDLTATHTCHFQEIHIYLHLSRSIYQNFLTLCSLPSYTFQAFYLFYIIHEF